LIDELGSIYVPTAHTVPPAAATPVRLLKPPGLPFGVDSRVHVVPFQWAAMVSLRPNPARFSPTAQTSPAETAATPRSTASPGKPVRVIERQDVPSYCNARAREVPPVGG
jgi:hypothetical protein